MSISEDYFQGTKQNPFCYEQEDWVLVRTTRQSNIYHGKQFIAGRTDNDPCVRETVYFDYEALSSSPSSTRWPMMHIVWVPGEQSFVDSYSERQKTPEERFEDGIAWSVLVATAHDAPKNIIDAIATSRSRP